MRSGRIERIETDPVAARDRLAEAKRHLASAARIADDDPNGAYALLWDGARKAVTALMLANGYRATSRPAAHEAVVRYAEHVLARSAAAEDVRHLDRMRRTRNRSEYGAKTFGRAEIAADLAHVRAMVDAVGAKLRG